MKHPSIIFAGLAAASITVLSTVAPSDVLPEAEARQGGSFTVAAHRGYAAAATENTMASFRAAKRHGAQAVETDIMLTSDRGFLLMHDATLNRTTTCKGSVATRTMADIQARCLTKRTSARIPGANDVLSWAAKSGMKVILEIKPTARYTVEDFTRLTAIIDKHSMMSRTTILSSGLDRLKTAEEADSRLNTSLITMTWSDVAPAKAHVDGFNIYAKYLTRARVSALRKSGFAVMGRNTNSAADWKKIYRLGANGFVTDATPEAVKNSRVLARRR